MFKIKKSHITTRTPVVLLILDGWGYREASQDNALAQANLPHWDALWDRCPHTLIHTDGGHVGLPDGQIGSSEVGHLTMGAGRIVYQNLTRIDIAIKDGSFNKNASLLAACNAVSENDGTLHIMGLLSPGGVHSHEKHIFAMLKIARHAGTKKVAIHAFLDGRDTPQKSALASLEALQKLCDDLGNARIASISGRYYAMDRDQRWERTYRAWDAIVNAHAKFYAPCATDALHQAYARGETDEFVSPVIIQSEAVSFTGVSDGDAVIFMNFRADRARQLTLALIDKRLKKFHKQLDLSQFVCLTEYDPCFPMAVAFSATRLHNTLPDMLAQNEKTQLRIAETEKYAHITFFFNGGREEPYHGEQRILIPSPKVATYDQQPEMSCPELTEKLLQAIHAKHFDVVICNIANPDMVGHTGNFSAAVRAAEFVDVAIGKITTAIRETNSILLVTADHGNLELMRDPVTGQPHTAHTNNPVPLIYFGTRAVALHDGGSLCDIAPTILDLLDLPRPEEMTGRSLIT